MNSKPYIGVSATVYSNNPDCNYGIFFFTLENPKLEIFHRISCEDALEEISKYEKLGFTVTHEINPHDSSICTYSIHGFIE